jgi:hypothetical protein
VSTIDAQKQDVVGPHWDITTTVNLSDDGMLRVDMRLSNGQKGTALNGRVVVDLCDARGNIVYRYELAKTISGSWKSNDGIFGIIGGWHTNVQSHSGVAKVESLVVPYIKSVKIAHYAGGGGSEVLQQTFSDINAIAQIIRNVRNVS